MFSEIINQTPTNKLLPLINDDDEMFISDLLDVYKHYIVKNKELIESKLIEKKFQTNLFECFYDEEQENITNDIIELLMKYNDKWRYYNGYNNDKINSTFNNITINNYMIEFKLINELEKYTGLIVTFRLTNKFDLNLKVANNHEKYLLYRASQSK